MGTAIIPILQMKKLRKTKVKEFGQAHVYSESNSRTHAPDHN